MLKTPHPVCHQPLVLLGQAKFAILYCSNEPHACLTCSKVCVTTCMYACCGTTDNKQYTLKVLTALLAVVS